MMPFRDRMAGMLRTMKRLAKSQDPSTTDQFFLKAGYRSNAEPKAYTDSLIDSRTYQVPVYQYAAALVKTQGIQSVLDLGCGLGTKLVEYIRPLCEDVTGVDAEVSIERCREIHPSGKWLAGDLEDPQFSLDRSYDLIISADVIEHLLNPNRLLELARRCSHAGSHILLSTPERDLRRGPYDWGPPANPAHVREWNAAEFLAYLESQGIEISETRILDVREGLATCQMVVGSFSEWPAGETDR